MQTYTIYNDADYIHEIINQIANTKRGDRVSLISMVFEPSEQVIRSLTEQLIAAAKRGVVVSLALDAHSFMMTKKSMPAGPLFWRRDLLKAQFPRHFYEKVQLLEALRQAGGHYEVINQPITWPTNPIAGRSHIKATVINDEVYIGGCNLGHTGQIDYMVRIRDAKTAAWVERLISNIIAKKSAWIALGRKDDRFVIDDQTMLFVDAGVKYQSLVFQEALQLIDQAREWLVITCQFLPNGVTGQHLAQAQSRGVKVYSIHNHPIKHDKITLPAHYLIRQREKLRHPKTLFEGELAKGHVRMHAKLIATDQGAMIGSHNYVSTGVRLGTAEIALLRHDAAFAHEAVSILLPQLSVSSDYSSKLSSISKLT